MTLPDAIQAEVGRAYRALGAEAVAIRSSGLEEDTERRTLAGQFETFLFVRGELAVLSVLTRAWAGLWTERAIRDRQERRDARRPHGGIIVQRMVNARASGVVQTINAAQSKPFELVVNVGLGLGEGIVSGVVAADHIVVAKPLDASSPPRFRYRVADKRERVVYDERFGQGTVRVDTLAHQRLRPALEYQELVEVVDAAMHLERAYGSPLDIEFGLEGPQLHILQVRPVPSAFGVWHETAERYPLQVRASVEVPS
jgi:pyruvate,water dikinase